MKVLDARGLSCPEPVIIMRKAMMSKDTEYEMLGTQARSSNSVFIFYIIYEIYSFCICTFKKNVPSSILHHLTERTALFPDSPITGTVANGSTLFTTVQKENLLLPAAS